MWINNCVVDDNCISDMIEVPIWTSNIVSVNDESTPGALENLGRISSFVSPYLNFLVSPDLIRGPGRHSVRSTQYILGIQ